jgi:phosphohistidine phosphatase
LLKNPGRPENVNRLPQASAVPYRIRSGKAEVLLITSHKGNWIFPKGIIDAGETAEQTALKESREEAGIGGRIVGPPIGSYTYEKWDALCEVTVFLLEVESEDPRWLEGGERQRAWFSFEDARSVIEKKKLLRLLDSAEEALAGKR